MSPCPDKLTSCCIYHERLICFVLSKPQGIEGTGQLRLSLWTSEENEEMKSIRIRNFPRARSVSS